jgi:hypothetical protein
MLCSCFFSYSYSASRYSYSYSIRSNIAIRSIGPQVTSNGLNQRPASPQFTQPSSTSTVSLSTASLSTSTTKYDANHVLSCGLATSSWKNLHQRKHRPARIVRKGSGLPFVRYEQKGGVCR